MKVSVSDLGSMGVTGVVIESVDLSLYIAHARIDGEEHVIADRQGKVLKTRNLLEMQRMLRKAVTCEFFLRQRSAYDEMVGHAHQAADNSMELPLGREPPARVVELASPEHSQLTVQEATYPFRSTSHYSSVERSSSPSLCPQSRLAFKY